MGQSHSEEKPTLTKEQVSHNLALRFLRHCFTEIEVYSFKDNFISLAQAQLSNTSTGEASSAAEGNGKAQLQDSGKILYWTEDTLTRFLGIPDALDPVGSILYQSTTYLGAFPFEESLAPVVLTFEALAKVVVLMTGRHRKAIKTSAGRDGIDTIKLLWKSFAVWERVIPEEDGELDQQGSDTTEQRPTVTLEEEDLFAIGGDDEDEDGEDDLTLAALNTLDANDVFILEAEKSGRSENQKPAPAKPRIQTAHIPIDNLQKLVMLLLLIAPLEPKQPIAVFVDRFTGEGLIGLQRAADNVVRGFNNKGKRAVGWREFKAVMKRSTPYLFSGLAPLFEHLLFSKNVDMSAAARVPVSSANNPATPHLELPNLIKLTQPLLPNPGKIMTVDVLSQLSMFIKGSIIWRRLRLLYAGSEAGFSMGSFETKVLKWQAPTILLVSGTRISDPPQTSPERAFCDSLPPKKYPTSKRPEDDTTSKAAGKDGGEDNNDDDEERFVFGVYLNTPWKHSHKENFGDTSTLLFQLEPAHEVFLPSKTSTFYAHFNKSDGIAFGNQLPQHTGYNKSHSSHHRGVGHGGLVDEPVYKNLGPVSLTFDESLEFGVFNHIGDGGAFHRSDTRRILPHSYSSNDATSSSGNSGESLDFRIWQERFQIEEIEVWGCGGDKEAEEQRKMWAWEEREALLRRQVSLGKDIEADRALLELAGLIGQGRSGGSM